MSVVNLLGSISTYVILAFFAMGIFESASLVTTQTSWYRDTLAHMMTGDFTKVIDLTKMGIGWVTITPTVNFRQLPIWLQWYGPYYSIFIPSGYIPIPGLEIFIFLLVVFVFVLLPLAFILKRSRKRKAGESPNAISPFGLPIWYYLSIPAFIMLLYPFWIWFNLQLFIYGAAGFFNVTPEAAEGIWTGIGQKSESFSFFFLCMSLLGLYKAVAWSKKIKVF